MFYNLKEIIVIGVFNYVFLKLRYFIMMVGGCGINVDV